MCVGDSVWLGWSGIRVAGWSTASACTTPTQPHRISNTHRNKNNTINVVIQQNSRKLLMMDILMSETCWAHNKWNKIASDIKLVFYSSTIAVMHGPINISPLKVIVMLHFMFWMSTIPSEIIDSTIVPRYKSVVMIQWLRKQCLLNLKFIGPCIIVIVEK